MGKTCAVGLWSSGCKKHKGVKIHGFPDDPEECERWIKALPNILPPGKKLDNVGVCVKHWPVNHPTYRVKGKDRPTIGFHWSSKLFDASNING